MKDPSDILKMVRAFANRGVIEHTFESGEFFNGGEFQIRVDQYSETQCKLKKYDPDTESFQFFCQGRFMDNALREFHFVMNVSQKDWQFKLLQSNINDSWGTSTFTYTLPTTAIFVEELARAIKSLK